MLMGVTWLCSKAANKPGMTRLRSSSLVDLKGAVTLNLLSHELTDSFTVQTLYYSLDMQGSPKAQVLKLRPEITLLKGRGNFKRCGLHEFTGRWQRACTWIVGPHCPTSLLWPWTGGGHLWLTTHSARDPALTDPRATGPGSVL